MIKQLAALTLMAGLAAGVQAGDRVGLAEASGSYSIVREGISVPQRANVPSAVMQGDQLQSSEAPVRLQLSGQDSLLLSEQGLIQFTPQGALVNQGVAAIAFEQGSESTVICRGVAFSAPLQASQRSLLAVQPAGNNAVLVEGLQYSTRMTDAETGAQIGFVSMGDKMLVYRTEKGWQTAAPGTGQPGEQGPTAVEDVNVVEAEEQSAGEEGVALFGLAMDPSGTGAGATTAGGGTGVAGVSGGAGGGLVAAGGAGGAAGGVALGGALALGAGFGIYSGLSDDGGGGGGGGGLRPPITDIGFFAR